MFVKHIYFKVWIVVIILKVTRDTSQHSEEEYNNWWWIIYDHERVTAEMRLQAAGTDYDSMPLRVCRLDHNKWVWAPKMAAAPAGGGSCLCPPPHFPLQISSLQFTPDHRRLHFTQEFSIFYFLSSLAHPPPGQTSGAPLPGTGRLVTRQPAWDTNMCLGTCWHARLHGDYDNWKGVSAVMAYRGCTGSKEKQTYILFIFLINNSKILRYAPT